MRSNWKSNPWIRHSNFIICTVSARPYNPMHRLDISAQLLILKWSWTRTPKWLNDLKCLWGMDCNGLCAYSRQPPCFNVITLTRSPESKDFHASLGCLWILFLINILSLKVNHRVGYIEIDKNIHVIFFFLSSGKPPLISRNQSILQLLIGCREFKNLAKDTSVSPIEL